MMSVVNDRFGKGLLIESFFFFLGGGVNFIMAMIHCISVILLQQKCTDRVVSRSVFFGGILQLPASSIPDLLITRIEVTFHP